MSAPPDNTAMPGSPPDGAGKWKWIAVSAIVVAALALGGVVFAATRDGSSGDQSAASQRIAATEQACRQWLANAPDASGPTSQTWCRAMSQWMHGQITNGSMTGPMMWGSPQAMNNACHAWAAASPSRGTATTDPSTASGWCDQMVAWMSGHMGTWNSDWGGSQPSQAACTAPSLAGTLVQVTLDNTGGSMMGGDRMGGSMMSDMMRLSTSTDSVQHGMVSFVATNVGSIDHELVILPLGESQQAGTRSIGNDGKVDESSSLGEASKSCGSGAGDGISPGASGWVSLDLAPGRYELICNLPGHYGAGMHAALTVT